jgi:L-rhamnose mutarotase
MKAYRHLVKHALAAGHLISAWDGEEWPVKRSTKYKEIIDAIESVEVAEIKIYDLHSKSVGWAMIIPFGLDDDETVADHTMTEFMQQWWEIYEGSLA